MSRSKRNSSVVKTTLALAVFVLPGAVMAQESTDNADNRQQSTASASNRQARDAHQTRSSAEARQMATAFGVSELNDIENWKITHGGNELGEIDRIAIDRNTGDLLAVVGLEGVVGLNMKEVAVPLKDLKMAGEETLSTDLTKEQLQQKRDIDPWDGTYPQTVEADAAR